MHDANKVLLGQTGSSAKDISEYDDDPADFPAGRAVRQGATGLSLAEGDGKWAGISIGKALSDSTNVSVVRAGESVPIECHDVRSDLTVGDLTFTAAVPGSGSDGDNITIALIDDATAGDESVEVSSTDIIIHMDDSDSTAQQIADAINASPAALALVSVAIAAGEESTEQDAAAEAPLSGGLGAFDFVVIGEKVYIDDATGKANDSGETVTISDAIYIAAPVVGIAEDGSLVSAALIDMPGGL